MQDLWDEVQRGLRDHLGAARTKRTRQSSDALLIGKLYDDGRRMSPTWARRGSKRWRYYVSQAALQGDKSKAGSILRVRAADIETLVAEALGKVSPDRAASQADIREHIAMARNCDEDHRMAWWWLIALFQARSYLVSRRSVYDGLI
jgi:site-specific DNA recombinase